MRINIKHSFMENTSSRKLLLSEIFSIYMVSAATTKQMLCGLDLHMESINVEYI